VGGKETLIRKETRGDREKLERVSSNHSKVVTNGYPSAPFHRRPGEGEKNVQILLRK